MLTALKTMLRLNGYTLYTRPYELNIVGLRSASTRPNRFDDELHVFFKTRTGTWEYHIYRITTDPGTYWLKNPMQPKGTAILAQGQYVNAYQLGLHRGQYKALVQRKPVNILRDYDRDAVLDFNNGKPERGLFGINLHRAAQRGSTRSIDKYSAGCQVFENAQDFARFIAQCEQHRERYGNQFTYTLLDYRAMQRSKRRIAGYYLAAGATVLGLGAWLINRTNFKTQSKKKEV